MPHVNSQDQVGKLSEKTLILDIVSFFILEIIPFLSPKSAISSFIPVLLVSASDQNPPCKPGDHVSLPGAFKAFGLDPISKSWCPGLQFWCFLNICIVLGIDQLGVIFFHMVNLMNVKEKITIPATWSLEILLYGISFCMTPVLMMGKSLKVPLLRQVVFRTDAANGRSKQRRGQELCGVKTSRRNLMKFWEKCGNEWAGVQGGFDSGWEKCLGKRPTTRHCLWTHGPPTFLHKDYWIFGELNFPVNFHVAGLWNLPE